MEEAPGKAFQSNFDALTWANATVLVMPCGRSAHMELGWTIGQGKARRCVCPRQREGPGPGPDAFYGRYSHRLG